MKNGIKKYRLGLLIENKPYSQSEMAQYINDRRPAGVKPVHRVRMSYLETGNTLPEPWELALICEFLNCKPEDLYSQGLLNIINGIAEE